MEGDTESNCYSAISHDFIVRGPVRDGKQIIHEYSAGGIPFIRRDNAFILKTKTGDKQSFYFPKGHIQIKRDGFPENIIEAASRETREELGLDALIGLHFNGILHSEQEHRNFTHDGPHADEDSYKTITYVGLDVQGDMQQQQWEAEGKQVRILSYNQAREYIVPKHRHLLDMAMSNPHRPSARTTPVTQ